MNFNTNATNNQSINNSENNSHIKSSFTNTTIKQRRITETLNARMLPTTVKEESKESLVELGNSSLINSSENNNNKTSKTNNTNITNKTSNTYKTNNSNITNKNTNYYNNYNISCFKDKTNSALKNTGKAFNFKRMKSDKTEISCNSIIEEERNDNNSSNNNKRKNSNKNKVFCLNTLRSGLRSDNTSKMSSDNIDRLSTKSLCLNDLVFNDYINFNFDSVKNVNKSSENKCNHVSNILECEYCLIEKKKYNNDEHDSQEFNDYNNYNNNIQDDNSLNNYKILNINRSKTIGSDKVNSNAINANNINIPNKVKSIIKLKDKNSHMSHVNNKNRVNVMSSSNDSNRNDNKSRVKSFQSTNQNLTNLTNINILNDVNSKVKVSRRSHIINSHTNNININHEENNYYDDRIYKETKSVADNIKEIRSSFQHSRLQIKNSLNTNNNTNTNTNNDYKRANQHSLGSPKNFYSNNNKNNYITVMNKEIEIPKLQNINNTNQRHNYIHTNNNNLFNSKFNNSNSNNEAKNPYSTDLENKENKNKPKILIVDDVSYCRISIKNVLKKILKEKNLDYEIIEEDDGIGTINRIFKDRTTNNNQIKLVISDENMNFINGSQSFNVLSTLENKGCFNYKIKKVILTAIEDAEALCNLKAKGNADGVYKKPANKYILEEILTKNLIDNI